jgi:hypothetical protein
MEDTVDTMVGTMDTIDWIDGIVRALGVKNYTQLTTLVCSKPKKDVIGGWLCDTLCILRKLCIEHQDYRAIADPVPLQAELIKSQKQVVELQGELLACKDEQLACKNEQLQSLQSSVKDTVEESLKAEFVTYSSLFQSPAPAIAADTVKSFVKTVVEEEDRSRSLMLFGLAESANEKLSDRVGEVFQEVGEKPRFEACRLGKSSSSTDTKKVRPVRVTLSSATMASHILSKSRKLMKTVNHQSVFICPDRTPDQRLKHKELVLEMRAKETEEPKKKHFIRRGKVCSIDTADS